MARSRGTRATPGASMADVAKLAGVSGQTVSRVVNGNPRVSAGTRAKVEAAMGELGYRANTAARALATGRFRSIGIVAFNLTRLGNIRIVESVVAGAQARGYSTSLAVVDNPTEHEVRAAVRGLTDRAVDGIIVIEARVLDTPYLQLPADVPVVIADSAPPHDHPTFGMDEAAGARAAVAHLLDLGHTTVHHIAGPPGSNPARRRRAAWKRLLQREDRPVPAPVVGDWSPASGYGAARTVLTGSTEVTAIFAANDDMAAGAVRAAHDLGRRLPADLSIVGYDDLDIAAVLSPPLTTVRQDLNEVGRRCVAALLGEIDGVTTNGADPARLVQPELVIRDSTAPPRRRQ